MWKVSMRKACLVVTSLVFLGACFFVFDIAPNVKAATLYVGGGGPGNYTSIQSAIENANPGDTIYVYSGTYYENVLISKTLSMIGEDKDTTIIDGSLAGDVVFVTADWVNITRFTARRGRVGIGLSFAENCNITNNNVSNNNWEGIFVDHDSNGNTIASNNASGNMYGISLRHSVNNSIVNNTASTNTQSGISVYRSDNNTISNNTAFSNEVAGINLDDSNNNTVADNSISNNWDGILIIDGSDRNTVANNIAFSNNWSGINLAFSGNNTMASNNLFANDVGIQIGNSDSNTIVSNKVSSNNWYGIYLDSSESDIITDNLMVEDGVYIGGDSLENWNTHTIDSSNTVNGKPVYYWKNVGGGTIPSDAGQVILANCTDVVIENQNVSNSSVGIELGFSSDNTIANNTANWNDRYGISLWHSDGNTITNHTSSHNEGGIDLWRSDGNIIANSVASNNNEGIRTYSSFDNRIYHNNLIGNAHQAYDIDGANDWDDGYPSGGNYWSDYTGVDEKGGPNQDQDGSDGIGDTAYEVPGGTSEDWYPLMDPFVPPSPSAPSAPQDLDAIAGNQWVTLTWTAPASDGGSPTTKYRIYRGTESGGETILVGTENALTYTDPGLTNGQTYFYEVSAMNVVGEGPRSNEASATPATVPSAPVGLIAVAGNGQVALNWSPPSDDGGSPITNYTIYRGTTSGEETFLTTLDNVLSYVDSGLTNGVTYYYKVAAVNDVGEGEKSTDVTAIPKPPPEEEVSIFEQAWFWVAAGVVMVVILLAVFILIRRRKEKQGESESPESG